jgi:hypothetical protein
MERRDFGVVLAEAQTLFSVGTVAALSDDYLLDSFLSRCEDAAEVAFEALVRRHGPMVLRVCRAAARLRGLEWPDHQGGEADPGNEQLTPHLREP